MNLPLTESEIEQIVQNVLRQIPHVSVPVVETTKAINPTRFTERVITAETLKNRGVTQTTIQVTAGAIITPSARDYLKQHQLQIVPISTEVDHKPAAQKSTAKSVLLLEVQTNSGLRSALQAVAKQTGGSWQKQTGSNLSEAVDAAISEIYRGNSTNVVMVSNQPAQAACLVNRQDKVRALVVKKSTDMQEAAEMKANVFVLPAQGLSIAEGLQIFRAVFTCGKGA